jgi:PPM family protein phosphatase
VQLAVAARTDIGRMRAGNEDNFHADANEYRGLFIVADGMGGHAAGEVASEMAVQIIARELAGVRDLRDGAVTETVTRALKLANSAIFQRTIQEVDKQGMGTTASVLLLGQNRYFIGQVGDSRVYLLRDGALRQITKDHSYVQEQVDAGYLTPEQARYHPYSNVITRCVGASDNVEPDTYAGEVRTGDVYLVASDGLTGMVDDRRLQQVLMTRTSPARIVDMLVQEANGRGGLDNITAIVVQVPAIDAGRAEDVTQETPAIKPPPAAG